MSHPRSADDETGAGRGRSPLAITRTGGTMASMNENERTEYSILMSRGRDAEPPSPFCWIASGVAATMLLSWGMAAHSPALMLPVIFCVAYGFYTMCTGASRRD